MLFVRQICLVENVQSHQFYFKLRFSDEIPVQDLQVFYKDYIGNTVKEISYEINDKNE